MTRGSAGHRPAPVRELLEAIFRRALDAVDADRAVRAAVVRRGDALVVAGEPVPRDARLFVLAAGKAAGAMAAALESRAGDRIAAGLAVTTDGCGVPLRRIDLREAGHPLPDARGERAARDALALVSRTRPGDVLVALLSGGASALLACPAPGLELADLAAATRALLGAGAEIDELNAVRKHLSALAGGRLARRVACERIELLALSDVPGDRLDLIGSGPLTADPTRYADALHALEARGALNRVPARVRAHLEAGARGERDETPKPGEAGLARVRATLLVTNRTAVQAAVRAAGEAGLRPALLPAPIRGEASRAGRRLAALARAVSSREPVCLVVGGETAVTVRGRGRGGRSQELALAAAVALEGDARVSLLAAGTDGTDGPTDAAGAYADGGTVRRGRARGCEAREALADNDSYGFFSVEGGRFATGPTRTNVMDLVLLHVAPVSKASRTG